MLWLDKIFASKNERKEARGRADLALRDYGARAEQVLREKLKDPDRKKSRRSLRLAIALIQAMVK
jgi:hypothetical protein